VSCRKLACIATDSYASELLSQNIKFVTETRETFNSVLDTSVVHMNKVGTMLMDELAHVNERVDHCWEKIKKLEKEVVSFQEWILVAEDEREGQSTKINLLKGEVITLKDLV
jgi:uncharacterized protein Yka (UPF0111/DUF47 family)